MSAHHVQEDEGASLLCACTVMGAQFSCIAHASQEDGLCDDCRVLCVPLGELELEYEGGSDAGGT